MFPWARTILDIVLPPAGPLMIVIAGGILMKTRYKRIGRTLVIAGFAVLYLLSTAVVSNILIRPLERDYKPVTGSLEGVDAVVVLTSGARDLSYIGLGPVSGSGSLRRLAEGIRVARGMNETPLVIAGGRADPARPDLSIGEALWRDAVSLGFSKERLILEDDSRNTYESALNLRMILGGGKTVILVTSAYHMGRSVMLFKKVGFEVVPSPTDFRSGNIPFHVSSILPSGESIGISSRALYEYLCRLWYIIKGIIN